MTPLTLRVLVCGLAAFRLARAIAVDDIMLGFRAWLHEAAYGPDPGDPVEAGVFWRWAYALFSCPFCVGFWISLALYAMWTQWGWARPGIAAVAVAGVAAQLAGFDRATSVVDDDD